MKKVKLELISDADMYLFFEEDMRDEVLEFWRDIVKEIIST